MNRLYLTSDMLSLERSVRQCEIYTVIGNRF